MAALPPDAGDDTGVTSDSESAPGMPRWVKVSALIVGAIVLFAIGVMLVSGQMGGHGPGRHGAGGSGSVGAQSEADHAARTLQVTALDTMTFEPSSIPVAARETVTFVVTNRGQAVHEFTIGDAAMQQEHAGMMEHAPDGMAHETPNSIRLQPGETKQLTWQFGSTGTLEYACHEPGHYQAGMRGMITIT
jgi:uncharacterized cupredoxin-like copper-binding protein